MRTLLQFLDSLETIPLLASYYLAEVSEKKGKQELFTQQSPQRLKKLIEYALVESTVSSNRIEGVNVAPSRVATIVFGQTALKNRSEEELKGYQKALSHIHENHNKIDITESSIKLLHKTIKEGVWDSGEYRNKIGNIIQTYPDGRSRIRFKTVEPQFIKSEMTELIELYQRLQDESKIHPLLVLIAFNFDFLCIHPFRDGNGRISRLLFLLMLHQEGYNVGKYISLERLIERDKLRYYETLEESSEHWHEGNHSAWSFIQYMLYILKTAYKDFEERAVDIPLPKGEKTKIIINAIKELDHQFTVKELEIKCLTVSREMIRKVLRNELKKGHVICLSKGPGAKWQKEGNTY